MFFSQPLQFVTYTLSNPIPLTPYMPSLGSNGPYSLVLGIHFTSRVAPTTIRREHNNRVSKFWVDTDRETKNTTTLSPAGKEQIWICCFLCERACALIMILHLQEAFLDWAEYFMLFQNALDYKQSTSQLLFYLLSRVMTHEGFRAVIFPMRFFR